MTRHHFPPPARNQSQSLGAALVELLEELACYAIGAGLIAASLYFFSLRWHV